MQYLKQEYEKDDIKMQELREYLEDSSNVRLPAYIEIESIDINNRNKKDIISPFILKKDKKSEFQRTTRVENLCSPVSLPECCYILLQARIICCDKVSRSTLPKPMLDSLLAWFDAIESESEYTIMFKLPYDYLSSKLFKGFIHYSISKIMINYNPDTIVNFIKYCIKVLQDL